MTQSNQKSARELAERLAEKLHLADILYYRGSDHYDKAIDLLEKELAPLVEAQERFKEITVHFGNMLDETITTKRGDWPRDLHCVLCECNVSKGESHKSNCTIVQANEFYDKLTDAAMKGQQ